MTCVEEVGFNSFLKIPLSMYREMREEEHEHMNIGTTTFGSFLQGHVYVKRSKVLLILSYILVESFHLSPIILN